MHEYYLKMIDSLKFLDSDQKEAVKRHCKKQEEIYIKSDCHVVIDYGMMIMNTSYLVILGILK